MHFLRVQLIAKEKFRGDFFLSKTNSTCETSSSSADGGSLPLFMIFVPVLIVDTEISVKQSEKEESSSSVANK